MQLLLGWNFKHSSVEATSRFWYKPPLAEWKYFGFKPGDGGFCIDKQHQ